MSLDDYKNELNKTINNWINKNEDDLNMIYRHNKMYYRVLKTTKRNLEELNDDIKTQLGYMEDEKEYGEETYDYGVLVGELGQLYKRRDYYEMVIKLLESPKKYFKEEEKQ
jgi:hypothetical protein